MNIWGRHATTVKHIGTIGQTKCWSQDVALKKIFGSFSNPTGALFTEVITTLNAMIDNEEIRETIKSRVLGYIESLLKFETALTAQLYLQYFPILRHSAITCRLYNWIY